MTTNEIWNTIEAVRKENPLVHNITNFVVMNNSANALLAFGASPAMVHSSDEVEEFVRISKALVINIGTLYSEELASMKLAAQVAMSSGIPWVLDPVGVGATSFRKRAVSELLKFRPTVIRGNASEIISIAGDKMGAGKGVDSTESSDTALFAAHSLSENQQCAVAITGAIDYVVLGKHRISIHNGHPLMPQVTGLGCSLTAIVGACLAVDKDIQRATVAAVSYFGIAGEIAAEESRGPGTLQTKLLDALYSLDRETFLKRARIEKHD